MRTFPMPPPQGYAQTKTFGYAGDYGYYLVPSSSSYGQGADASDYYYVKYDGVAGKNVWIYGAWGVTPIPAATPDGDVCGHAHTSYGVWARYQYRRWFGFPLVRGFGPVDLRGRRRHERGPRRGWPVCPEDDEPAEQLQYPVWLGQ